MLVRRMNRFGRPLGLALAVALAAIGHESATAADTLAAAFSDGDFGLGFRYRLESVDQEGFEEDALASTLRTRLNFKSGDWRALSLFLEFDYVAEVLANDYNAGAGNTPDRTEYPVVADPEGPDLNQAYLQFRLPAGVLAAGRQRIIYDNARFIGNVGWRQNEQTFDAASYRYQAGIMDLQLAYIDQVNRIFGRDVPDGQHGHNTWLFNVAAKIGELGTLSGYYYDIDDEYTAAFSTRSFGARFGGSSGKFSWSLEYARQDDAHANPVDYQADYARVDLSVNLGSVTPYVGFESLGGDSMRSGAAFRTPLATLHAFNGWADLFLNTPNAGLEDAFVGAKGAIGQWKWDVIYHDFSAESGSGGFGSELDASLSRNFLEHYSALFKAAWFNADSGAPYPDVTKLWLMLTADF